MYSDLVVLSFISCISFMKKESTKKTVKKNPRFYP